MSNSLNRLGAVLSRQQRTIVTVVETYPNGTSLVQYTDGSSTVLLGNAVENGSAYVENGRIIGPASVLPFSEIEV
ncbi:hypothetical protein P4S60_10320 [Pseudoalteromonas sp. Hal040]|uniref:hypothetical protein n=1 Tax=unclassified Pseudoalteromonas TaxID=194690 RepID=UPI00301D6395